MVMYRCEPRIFLYFFKPFSVMTWLECGQLRVETNIMMALIGHFHVPKPLQETVSANSLQETLT